MDTNPEAASTRMLDLVELPESIKTELGLAGQHVPALAVRLLHSGDSDAVEFSVAADFNTTNGRQWVIVSDDERVFLNRQRVAEDAAGPYPRRTARGVLYVSCLHSRSADGWTPSNLRGTQSVPGAGRALLAKVRSEDWIDRDWDNAVVRIFWELP